MASAAPVERGALIALAAPLLAAAFAPIEGQAYRLTIAEQRLTARGQTEFVSERTIRFTREAAGYRAEVTIGPARAAGGPIAGLYLRGMQGLAGRRLVIHLDPRGAVRSVDDLDAQWRAYCDALADTGRDGPPPAPVIAIIDRLRAAPPAEQQRTLGSLITAGLAGARAELPAGSRAVTLPAREGAGELVGTERVTRDVAGLTIDTEAEGQLIQGGARGRVAIERRERIERGMIAETQETRRIWPKGDEAQPVLTITTRTTLRPVVS